MRIPEFRGQFASRGMGPTATEPDDFPWSVRGKIAGNLRIVKRAPIEPT